MSLSTSCSFHTLKLALQVPEHVPDVIAKVFDIPQLEKLYLHEMAQGTLHVSQLKQHRFCADPRYVYWDVESPPRIPVTNEALYRLGWPSLKMYEFCS